MIFSVLAPLDNIMILYGDVNFTELNVSKIYTAGATCCQVESSNKFVIDKLLHTNCTSLDRSSYSKAKFIEQLDMLDLSKITNSIFTNNIAYSAVEYYNCKIKALFENCYFSKNELFVLFRGRSSEIPEIIFKKVVIVDDVDIGTDGITYLSKGQPQDFFAGLNTAECKGYYSIHSRCLKSKRKPTLEGIIVLCFYLNQLNFLY